MDRERDARGTSVQAPLLWGLTALLVAIGVFLRAVEAHRKSLWLDEMHSLWAASGDGFAEVIERVRLDFHPPVYFLLLHLLEGLEPHAQRWLSILFSVATFVPLLALARSAGLSPLSRSVAAGLFATSPYQILYAAELRSYSALGFLATVMAWAAFTDRAAARWRFLAFAAAMGIGMNVHYFAGIAAVCILVARLSIRPRGGGGEGLLPSRRLLLAFAIGFVLFLPWLLAKERWVLTNPTKLWKPERPRAEASIAEAEVSARWRGEVFLKAATIPLRTHVPMLSSLGRSVSGPAQISAVAFFGLVFAGAASLLLRLLRGRSTPGGVRLWAPIAAGGLAYVAGITLCLGLWKGFPAQYFAMGAWIWPLLGAAFVEAIERERLRRIYAGALLAASLATGVCHVLGASRENMRGAVATALALGQPEGALYTAILWQPTWYPHTLPFDLYAPEVSICDPGEVPPAKDGEGRSVVVITRHVALTGDMSMPTAWKTIQQGRRIARSVWIDHSTGVILLVPE